RCIPDKGIPHASISSSRFCIAACVQPVQISRSLSLAFASRPEDVSQYNAAPPAATPPTTNPTIFLSFQGHIQNNMGLRVFEKSVSFNQATALAVSAEFNN